MTSEEKNNLINLQKSNERFFKRFTEKQKNIDLIIGNAKISAYQEVIALNRELSKNQPDNTLATTYAMELEDVLYELIKFEDYDLEPQKEQD